MPEADDTREPSIGARLRVDAACDRFEALWQSGARPDPAEIVAEVPGADRVLILLALIAVDVEYRRKSGEFPTPAEYLSRFPELEPPALNRVFGEATSTRDWSASFNSTLGGDLAAILAATEPAVASGLQASPTFPGYELLAELGHGGMAVVYKARQLSLNRTVALKTILRVDPILRARFLAEADAIAAIVHPHIVQVFDFGERDGTPYLAMEYVEGGTLGDLLVRARQSEGPSRFDARQTAVLLEKVASGVAAAHELGIVHRDLKPANILIDAVGEPKVADFGLAKRATGTDLTHTQAIMGTPAYMAPEQAKGAKFAGPPADVWALGVILYQCLTGKRPFDGDNLDAILTAVLTTEPIPVRRLVPTIPRDLATIVAKCLTGLPTARYPTAKQLADDLGRFNRGEPIQARPAGRIERTIRWTRRNPVQATLVGVVLVAIGAGLGAWSVHRARLHDDRIAASVERLAAVDTARLPELLEEMDRLGDEPEPHLRAQLRAAEPGSPRELHMRLALLPHEPDQLAPLTDRLLTASATDFTVLVVRLRPYANRLTPRLWDLVNNPVTDHDRRFRAACALAQYDPAHPGWASLAPTVVERLLASSVSDIAAWARQLVPIGHHLRQPLDAAFLAEASGSGSVAAASLAVIAVNDPEWLLAAVRTASPTQIGELAPALRRHLDGVRSGLLSDLDRIPPPNPLPGHVTIDWGHDRQAPVQAIRARAALTLLQLGEHEAAWRLLRFSEDSQARTYLLHWFFPSRFPLSRLVERFRNEPDVTARRALLQAIGEYPPAAMTPAERDRFHTELVSVYQRDPDPGIHSSAEWLLHRWKWADDSIRPEPSRNPLPGRLWYLTPSGHTFAVVRGPTLATLGTPENGELGRETSDGTEPLRTYRIDRDFAIATHEVTVAQFRRFTPEFISSRPGYSYSPEPDCPIAHIFWHAALDYCRWLTVQEGLGEEDQCYRSFDEGQKAGGRCYPDALCRRGYRLPTEAEWEYACRAGTTTSRYWGSDRGPFMRNYTVSLNFTENRTFPVRQRKPNDLGLFDPLGNVWEWCHDYFGPLRPEPPGVVNPDWGGSFRWDEVEVGLVRGPSFTSSQTMIRAAHRRKLSTLPPSYGDMGFRLARTLGTPTDAWKVRIVPLPPMMPLDSPKWGKLFTAPPFRELRLSTLDFAFSAGGHDHHFAIVAERIFTGSAGEYSLDVRADDGVRVYLDGTVIADHWNGPTPGQQYPVVLRPGAVLKVEYYQTDGPGMLRVAIQPRMVK